MNDQNRERKVTNLEELLDRILSSCEQQGRISVGSILDSVGRRSFGPLLLLAGLITLAPLIGDIPGMPTIMALLVFLTAGQLLLKRDHFWLPQIMLKRSISEDKLFKGVQWLRKPARFLDRWTKPRMNKLVGETGTFAIAVVCLLLAVGMPVLEFVPFSANGAGAALTTFGLALTSRDGLLALVAMVLTAGTAGGVLYSIIG